MRKTFYVFVVSNGFDVSSDDHADDDDDDDVGVQMMDGGDIGEVFASLLILAFAHAATNSQPQENYNIHR